ncbi:MAG: T9SS type A sorting domain-containing protein [Sphingobacteriaceae bacterium]|nr:T9SS type A sorting domain-containing protein [Sphingobacteriaceae bacterium]
MRSNTLSAFSTPTTMITSLNNTPEAPTLTTNKNVLYYHKKSGGVFTIFMKYKTLSTGITEAKDENNITIYPNPNNGSFTVRGKENESIIISNQLGQEIKIIYLSDKNNFSETISGLENGIYFLNGKSTKQKIVVLN